jgi:poly(3-hydroxyoctanoate) depolymerase
MRTYGILLCALGCGPLAEPGINPQPVPEPPAPQPAASRCTIDETGDVITCEHQKITVDGRVVLWETPLGETPAAGWPVVLIFQGSLQSPDGQSSISADGMWSVQPSDVASFGIFANYALGQLRTQTLVIKRLLDAGYAVITPTADFNGLAWDTNLPPWLYQWSPAPDNQFLLELFSAMHGGRFGTLSAQRWYATGVSSGGYMTSRMAVSYRGQFRALAIAAGSYATCGGDLPCNVPALPLDHPPTLFLHGGSDPLVPIAQMYAYHDQLESMGLVTRAVVNPALKHGWIPEAPDAVVSWFDAH